VRGHGDDVGSARLDGRVMERAEIPADAVGVHVLEITMNGRWPAAAVNLVENRFAPATPRAQRVGGALVWRAVPGAVRYVVHRNGRAVARTTGTRAILRRADGLDEYQVLAVSAAGDESFLSEPVRVVAPGAEQLEKPEGADLEREYPGFSGAGYVRLTRERNVTVRVPIRVAREGIYAVDARYANGNGPVNTADKVAVRTLLVNGDTAGVLVMPQRGENRWSDWAWSSALLVRLRPGAHTLTIAYTPLDENMNRHENTALLDQLRLTRLAPDSAPRFTR
jgi:hypothetical protein